MKAERRVQEVSRLVEALGGEPQDSGVNRCGSHTGLDAAKAPPVPGS